MPAPKIPEGFATFEGKIEDLNQIADELCFCGALKSEHMGFQGHGRCDKTGCSQFTWYGFLRKVDSTFQPDLFEGRK